MRRNCDLELRLVTPSVHSYGLNQTSDGDVNQDEKQNLTVFYNGKIAAWDVTELQARAIISLASNQETEARNSVVVRSITKSEEVNSPTTVAINSRIYSPTSTALSMKKSLQRFLEKRKNRAQATSPYYYKP